MRNTLWPVLLCWCALGNAFCVHAGDAPEEEKWRTNRALYENGLKECEAFRQGLLRAIGSTRMTQAELVGQAIQRFPGMCRTALLGRPNLDEFHVPADAFLRQVRGRTSLDGERAFGRFTGRWYGLWDQMRVDHHWWPVEQYEPPKTVGRDLPRIVASQYSWIGDGFCWNYIVQPRRDPSCHVILGMAYHLDPSNAKEIRLRRPHVGYLAGPGKLIWVTAKEIFLEQAMSPKEGNGMVYTITGFKYEIREAQLRSREDAFQAVYTRQKDRRPPWFRFPIDLQVGEEKERRKQ